ncbi:MAG: bacteriohemerythrin [Smithellaceae bacterium]
MDTISRLNWNETYSVSLDLLDAEHRKFFNVINQLISAHEREATDYLPTISKLIHYSYFTFHQEHLAMMIANYPGFARHIREHQKFTAKMEEFLKDYVIGRPDLGEKMIIFLKSWVREHIIPLDVQFGYYLRRNPQMHEQIQKAHTTMHPSHQLHVVNA